MKPRSAFLIIAVLGASLAFMSFKNNKHQQVRTEFAADTVPDRKVRDLDELLEEMNSIDLKLDMEKMSKELADGLKELDGKKITLDVQKALESINLDEMKKSIELSLASIDLDEMRLELQESMKELEGKELKLEIENALKEIDSEKIQQEIKKAMSEINWDETRKSIDNTKKIDLKEMEKGLDKARKEIEKIGPTLKEELAKAQVEIEKAKAEIKEYKVFVDGLDKDGLIKKSESYTIEHKDGELLINGKKASDATYKKYRSFLDKHKKFNIEKSEDDFDIDMD